MNFRLWAVGFGLSAVLLAAGCPANVPGESPKQLTIEDQLQGRPPVARLSDEELKARESEDKAVGELAADDLDRVDREQKARWIASIKRWCFWLGLAGLALTVVAAAATVKFPSAYRWTLGAAGCLAGFGTLCFCASWVASHYVAVAWTVGVLMSAVVVAFVIKLLDGQWQEMKDGLSILAKKTDAKAEDYAKELSEAKVHNVESFKALLAKVKG